MDKIKAVLSVVLTAPVRKAIYGLVAAGFALSFALGFGDAGDQSVVQTAMDNAYELLTALAGLMALVKTSDPEPDSE